jgi:hypothetical protein
MLGGRILRRHGHDCRPFERGNIRARIRALLGLERHLNRSGTTAKRAGGCRDERAFQQEGHAGRLVPAGNPRQSVVERHRDLGFRNPTGPNQSGRCGILTSQAATSPRRSTHPPRLGEPAKPSRTRVQALDGDWKGERRRPRLFWNPDAVEAIARSCPRRAFKTARAARGVAFSGLRNRQPNKCVQRGRVALSPAPGEARSRGSALV